MRLFKEQDADDHNKDDTRQKEFLQGSQHSGFFFWTSDALCSKSPSRGSVLIIETFSP
jgi:hypothetical protein